MNRKSIAAVCLTFLAFLLSPPLAAEDTVASLEEQSRQAYAEGRWVRYYIANRKLHEMRPFVPDYMLNVVRAAAQLNRLNTAYQYMHKLQQQGLSYDFNAIDDMASIRGTEAYDYMNRLMVEAGQPAGEGTVAFTIPGDPADFGAMDWDPGRKRFLVGTLRSGRLLAVTPEGEADTLLQATEANGLQSITGVAVDSERGILWLATAASEAFSAYEPESRGPGSVLQLDLDSLAVKARYDLPADGAEHELGSLALTGSGQVYVIDHATPVVYRVPDAAGPLEPFVTNTDLVGLSDIAVVPDNSRVFVSDPVMGVFVIDPVAQQAAMLSGPETLNLSGIRGIEVSGKYLFIVQGDLHPQRLMRLELKSDGATVEDVAPMAVSLPGFDHPGSGVVHEGALYYIANRGAQEGAGMVIMRTPLDAGKTIKSPDVRDFEKTMQEKQKG